MDEDDEDDGDDDDKDDEDDDLSPMKTGPLVTHPKKSRESWEICKLRHQQSQVFPEI